MWHAGECIGRVIIGSNRWHKPFETVKVPIAPKVPLEVDIFDLCVGERLSKREIYGRL